MQDVVLQSDGKRLTITIDLTRVVGPSSSGKTTLVATTNGSAEIPNAPGMKVGLNVYKK